MHCPNCGHRVDSGYERWLRFFANELRIATELSKAPAPVFTFLYHLELPGMIRAVYRVSIPKVEDPNNRGYRLIYRLGDQATEVDVQDGSELNLPAIEAPFSAILVPIGPDNSPRLDRASDGISFMVRPYNPPTPPDNGGDLQKAPKPEVAFVRFVDDEGNTVEEAPPEPPAV